MRPHGASQHHRSASYRFIMLSISVYRSYAVLLCSTRSHAFCHTSVPPTGPRTKPMPKPSLLQATALSPAMYARNNSQRHRCRSTHSSLAHEIATPSNRRVISVFNVISILDVCPHSRRVSSIGRDGNDGDMLCFWRFVLLRNIKSPIRRRALASEH